MTASRVIVSLRDSSSETEAPQLRMWLWLLPEVDSEQVANSGRRTQGLIEQNHAPVEDLIHKKIGRGGCQQD
jgi:hypothetical protein